MTEDSFSLGMTTLAEAEYARALRQLSRDHFRDVVFSCLLLKHLAVLLHFGKSILRFLKLMLELNHAPVLQLRSLRQISGSPSRVTSR